MEFPYLSIIHHRHHQNFIRYVEPPQQAGSSRGRRQSGGERGGKKFAEKCEGLFWRQTFLRLLFHFPSPLSGIAVQRRCAVKNRSALPRRKFSCHRVRGWMRRGGGGGRWTSNQRVERFSAEAAGWLLSDVVSYAIYSPLLPSCQSE